MASSEPQSSTRVLPVDRSEDVILSSAIVVHAGAACAMKWCSTSGPRHFEEPLATSIWSTFFTVGLSEKPA